MNFLPLPISFNYNEWFVIIVAILGNSAMLLVRRHFPISIFILIYLFSITIARIVDNLMAGSHIDLYDLMDTGNYDLFDMFTYFMYGPFAPFFIYFYHKWNIHGLYHLLYFWGWAIFCILFERLAIIFNVFTFNVWNQLYSLPVYLVVLTLLLVFYHCISKNRTRTDKHLS